MIAYVSYAFSHMWKKHIFNIDQASMSAGSSQCKIFFKMHAWNLLVICLQSSVMKHIYMINRLGMGKMWEVSDFGQCSDTSV